jgi:hypothetical protein
MSTIIRKWFLALTGLITILVMCSVVVWHVLSNKRRLHVEFRQGESLLGCGDWVLKIPDKLSEKKEALGLLMKRHDFVKNESRSILAIRQHIDHDPKAIDDEVFKWISISLPIQAIPKNPLKIEINQDEACLIISQGPQAFRNYACHQRASDGWVEVVPQTDGSTLFSINATLIAEPGSVGRRCKTSINEQWVFE